MQINSLNELIEKNNKLQGEKTSTAEREVFFETALKFIKKEFDKDIYNRCNSHIFPGISVAMSFDEREQDDKQKMAWICEYLTAHVKS